VLTLPAAPPAPTAAAAVAHWDWCTVALFTCTANCGGGAAGAATSDGAAACVEEEVAVVNERELHTLPEGGPGPAAAAAAGIPL
jgi:hypothetical protein